MQAQAVECERKAPIRTYGTNKEAMRRCKKTRHCLSKICRSRRYGSHYVVKERSSSAHAGTCELALKRYETNINAISPPPHRFCSEQAMRCEYKRRDKISRKFHRRSRLQPRYRRPSKRPPRKRDRRAGRANKTRRRRAVWLKFKRPRKMKP